MPSISWLFWLSSAPLIEIADVWRRSSGRVPLASEFGTPSLAPGTSWTRRTKLRPFTGRSCTAFSVTSALSVEVSVWSSGDGGGHGDRLGEQADLQLRVEADAVAGRQRDLRRSGAEALQLDATV